MTYKMREIELKDLKVGDEGVTEAINYLSFIKQCLLAPKNPQSGCTTAEIREVTPMLDLLDDAKDGDKIHFTESQWVNIKGRLKATTLQQNVRAFVHLEDDIIAAKEIELQVKEPDEEDDS